MGYTHTHTHKTHFSTNLNRYDHQREIDEHRRDQTWFCVWIPYAWRLSEEREADGREHSRGQENRAQKERVEQRRGKFPDTVSAPWSIPTKSGGKQRSTLQTEYAWRGERCSGNNKTVKSLSPQARCLAHLDLMSLLLFLHYFLSEWTLPNFYLLSSNP